MFFVDSNVQKISRNVAVQMAAARNDLAGSIYCPRSQSQAGCIKHQGRKGKQFANFLQHRYVKELQTRGHPASRLRADNKIMLESRVEVVNSVYEYNCKLGESCELKEGEGESDLSMLIPVCNSSEKPSVCTRSSDIALKNEGQMYVIGTAQTDFQPAFKQVLSGHAAAVSPGFHLSESSEATSIDFSLTLSKIKQLLIEPTPSLPLNFVLPSALRNTPTPATTQPDMHMAALQIFQPLLGLKPQLVSMRKFSNCVLISCKGTRGRVAVLWHFSGEVYVGDWLEEEDGFQVGCKQGLGLAYFPESNLSPRQSAFTSDSSTKTSAVVSG